MRSNITAAWNRQHVWNRKDFFQYFIFPCIMRRLKKTAIIFSVVLIVCMIIFFLPERRNVIKSQHFTFVSSGSLNTATIRELANVLEANYTRIGNDLKTKPATKIQINIYAQRWRYIKATGNWGGSGNIEGISKLHFLIKALGESDGKKVAIHEFAHTLTLKKLLESEQQPINTKKFDQKFSSFPVWLWEAISVYEAKQFVDPRTLPFLKNGQYPSISELNNRVKGGKVYSCGYTLVEFILAKYGHDRFLNLIKNYGDLKYTLGISDEQFCADWYAFVKGKYLG